MTAACDAWRYSTMLGIPTVVMGAGSLRYAHSNEEQITIRRDPGNREDAFVLPRSLVRLFHTVTN